MNPLWFAGIALVVIVYLTCQRSGVCRHVVFAGGIALSTCAALGVVHEALVVPAILLQAVGFWAHS